MRADLSLRVSALSLFSVTSARGPAPPEVLQLSEGALDLRAQTCSALMLHPVRQAVRASLLSCLLLCCLLSAALCGTPQCAPPEVHKLSKGTLNLRAQTWSTLVLHLVCSVFLQDPQTRPACPA